MLNKLFIAASILLFLWLGWSARSASLNTALPGLLVAFGLGAWMGWALKSGLVVHRFTELEDAWAARLHDKENELERTSAKLALLVTTLQADYHASITTIRGHEAAMAECQAKLADLEVGLAARIAELERTNETLSREAQDWETRYDTVVQDKEAEISRLQSRVRELEPITVRVQEEKAKSLRITRDKDAQINQLQRRIRELERLQMQSKHWMFSVLLQERETATAKLTPLHFR